MRNHFTGLNAYIERLKAMELNIIDNGGRRIGIERRVFSYAHHIPERRSNNGRRNWVDRRVEKKIVRALDFERRVAVKFYLNYTRVGGIHMPGI